VPAFDSTKGIFEVPEVLCTGESSIAAAAPPHEQHPAAHPSRDPGLLEHHFAALAERSVDAMFFLEAKTRRITEANSSFFRMLGYERADLGRLTLYDIVAEDPDNIDARIGRVATGQEAPLRDRVYRHKDGSLLDVEVFAAPLASHDTKLVGIIARDVTMRRKAEEDQKELRVAVLNAAAEWRDTFDSIPDAIFVLDAKGFIQRMNVAAKSYLHGDFGQFVSERLPSGDREPWTAVQELFSRSFSRVQTQHASAEDSRGRHFRLSVTKTDNDRFILMMHDLTHEHELQDSLKSSEAMSTLGALVGGVAHEARNPLFTLSALLQAFEARFGFTQDQAIYVQQIHTQLERLNHLMNELLQYGKAANFHREVTAVSELLKPAANLLAQAAAANKVTLNLCVSEHLKVKADPQQMISALRNVLDNAVVHSPRGATITAEVRQVEEKIQIEVRDLGPGFNVANAKDVFKPFFSKRPGGTGLGLAIVERIVREHNGTVSAGNHPEGGAVVTITLPAFSA
jgi:PAS domain S-box-containing protein